MKTLIVYYSYDGNSAFIAQELKSALGADCLRLEPADEKRRKGLVKIVWGATQVLSKRFPELKPFDCRLDDYDLIVLGTPVWAGSPAPALQSFLQKTALQGKKIGVFVCHAGGKGDAVGKLKAALPSGNTVVAEADFQNPLQGQGGELKAKIESFAKALKALEALEALKAQKT
jgi:flavodoxin